MKIQLVETNTEWPNYFLTSNGLKQSQTAQ